jgi:IclR family transcriptional regulator, acetate operon repressor
MVGAFVSGTDQRAEGEGERLVGSDRVLAVLVELADHPNGVTLDALAHRMRSSKSTVHRALTSLKRARLAQQTGRGVYLLGDEFVRLALRHQAERPESARIEPALRELAERYGETAHYAVLQGDEVVYRAKVDSPQGGVRLTSEVGGRNPAYRTAVGKLLLAFAVSDQDALVERVGPGPFEARTPKTITDIDALWAELVRTRSRGYAVDDQENELGVNCVAVPVRIEPRSAPIGAVSVSALAFRLPLARLEAESPDIHACVARPVSGDPLSAQYVARPPLMS